MFFLGIFDLKMENDVLHVLSAEKQVEIMIKSSDVSVFGSLSSANRSLQVHLCAQVNTFAV